LFQKKGTRTIETFCREMLSKDQETAIHHIPLTGAHMPIGPIIITVFMFTCIVLIWGAAILTRHRERMTMIEKGMSAEDVKSIYMRGVRVYNPRTPLMWGILFTAVGLGALIGAALVDWYHFDDGIVVGMMVLFGGIGLIIYYAVAGKKDVA
jgi:hypothetical protein